MSSKVEKKETTGVVALENKDIEPEQNLAEDSPSK